jgi:hypothetical protein
MGNEIARPSMPGSASLVERESNRKVTSHLTLVDEVDAVINEIISNDALQADWSRHNDPVFDDESHEGSVIIDKVRLADMVKRYAATVEGRYPLTEAALTHRVQQAVQAALRRTEESVNQRRTKAKAAA